MNNEWIGVEDKLPEPETDVLIAYAYGKETRGLFLDISCMFEDGSWATFNGIDVRYWVSLPKPPED